MDPYSPAAIAAHLDDVSMSYRGRLALDRVTVAFHRYRLTVVLGAPEVGRSTLLRCLTGLAPVDRGTVHLGGTELTALDDRQLTRLRRERMGFVLGSSHLMPTLTVSENIQLSLTIAGRRPDPSWLNRVVDATALRDRLRYRPAQLTRRERQQVGIARALSGRPELVLADEPAGCLGPDSRADLLCVLRRCVDGLGATIVMVTRSPLAADYADDVLHMAGGRLRRSVGTGFDEGVPGARDCSASGGQRLL